MIFVMKFGRGKTRDCQLLAQCTSTLMITLGLFFRVGSHARILRQRARTLFLHQGKFDVYGKVLRRRITYPITPTLYTCTVFFHRSDIVVVEVVAF